MIFDVAYILGKRYGPESLWNVGAYHPHYSVAAYFQSLAHYLKDLIYRPVNITAWGMAGLLAIMALLAAISRRRCLIWGLGFILAGVLPLAFIDVRPAGLGCRHRVRLGPAELAALVQCRAADRPRQRR